MVVRDDATVHNYFEHSVNCAGVGGTVKCIYNHGKLNYKTLAMQWGETDRNVLLFADGVKVRECHFDEDVNTLFDWIPPEEDTRRPWFEHLTIGGHYDWGEKAYMRFYAVLAVGKLLDEKELLAICRLFGTC